MATRLDTLIENLPLVLGDKIINSVIHVNEITITCKAADLLEVCQTLREHAAFKFEQLIDLCGVDYAQYGEDANAYEPVWTGLRYATVYHFLSISLNHRLRLKVFSEDDEFPLMPTLVNIWSVANWFEREAFDLYGIMYEGHPDLRRLLTDYGFVGHPFRKDFPMIGNVEMRYDPEQQRVIYQPVSIEQRNNVPRMIRNEGFHHG